MSQAFVKLYFTNEFLKVFGIIRLFSEFWIFQFSTSRFALVCTLLVLVTSNEVMTKRFCGREFPLAVVSACRLGKRSTSKLDYSNLLHSQQSRNTQLEGKLPSSTSPNHPQFEKNLRFVRGKKVKYSHNFDLTWRINFYFVHFPR